MLSLVFPAFRICESHSGKLSRKVRRKVIEGNKHSGKFLLNDKIMPARVVLEPAFIVSVSED